MRWRTVSRFASVILLLLFIGLLAGHISSSTSGIASITALGADQGEIQIGTYNLEFFTDQEPSTCSWAEGHNDRTQAQIEALAAFVDSLDIEVLALQEIENAAALDKLLEYLPANKYAYITSSQNVCQRVAVLYQPQEVSLSYEGEIPLSLGHRGLRDGLVVDGKILPDGFDFTLVVVHLKCCSDGQATRLQQLEILGNWLAERLQEQNEEPDIILAGDFNEHLLTNTGAFALLGDDLGLRILTQDAPNRTCTPPGHSYSDPIDHIIITPNANNEYEGETVFYNYFSDPTVPYRYSFSDHCVLWTTFSIEDLDGPQTLSTETGSGYIVINEFELNPSGKDAGNEWVELYNPTDGDIDIGDWTLSTTHGGTVTVHLPQGAVIASHDYEVYSYGKQWLDNKDESIILRDASGNEIDKTPISSDSANDGRSWQRCPNGQDTNSVEDWQFQPSTPGESNNC